MYLPSKYLKKFGKKNLNSNRHSHELLFITYQFERGRQRALMRKLQSFIRLIIDTKWSAYRAKNKPKIYRSTNCKIAIHVFLLLQIGRLICVDLPKME